MIKKYTTILFDADDTLLDFKKAEHSALCKVLTEYGIPATTEVTSRYSVINAGLWREFEKGNITKEDIKNRRYNQLFEEFGFDCPVSSRQVNDRYLELLGECGFLIDGADKLCRNLKEAGYKLYIITNGVTHTQANRMKLSGLDKYFDGVFVSENIGCQKPFIGFFEYVFENIEEKDKSRIIVIGDSLGSDIQGAENAGLDCIWFNKKGLRNEKKIKITYEVNNLDEINKIF